MQASSILIKTRTQVLILLAMLSLVLAACDTLTNPPEEEDVSFDGPPVVTISSPLNGDSYQEGVGVNILLRVDNAGPDVARVAIQVDGQIIGEAILPNPNGDPGFTVSNGWPASGEGSHTISAVASRSDGTVSEEASVTINVIAASQSESSDDEVDDNSDTDDSDTAVETEETVEEPTEGDSSAQQVEATNPPLPTAVPTNTPEPTAVPPTATPSTPQIVVRTGANIRSGPGQVFDPPIGSLAANATADILAVSTTGGWYKIRYYNGDGWISATVVDVRGDISSLPREAGPATPIPATNTPVATAVPPTPSSAPDLSITNVAVSPHPFVCNESSEIRVTISNSGNAASAGTSFRVDDIYNGSAGANTTGVVPELQPGASHTAVVYLTVSNNFSEAHHTRITVDPNGQVAESNEGNNVRNEAQYVLGTGGC